MATGPRAATLDRDIEGRCDSAPNTIGTESHPAHVVQKRTSAKCRNAPKKKRGLRQPARMTSDPRSCRRVGYVVRSAAVKERVVPRVGRRPRKAGT